MYIHLKQRNMKLLNGVEKCTEFTIIPDAFIPLEGEITETTYASIKKKTINLNYLKLRWNNLKVKFRKQRKG